MDRSRTVTTIFMVVALIVMAALAISVNRKSESGAAAGLQPLPGLTENLRSVERITAFPATRIRSVRIRRTNGDELAVIRERPASPEFQFETPPSGDITPYSRILFANAEFLDSLSSRNAFTVTGIVDERDIGELTYTSFDGLVLKCVVFRSDDTTGLRMIATHSEKLEARYENAESANLIPTQEIVDIANKLNGRVYRLPDS